jgi:hypothetical protein
MTFERNRRPSLPTRDEYEANPIAGKVAEQRRKSMAPPTKA